MDDRLYGLIAPVHRLPSNGGKLSSRSVFSSRFPALVAAFLFAATASVSLAANFTLFTVDTTADTDAAKPVSAGKDKFGKTSLRSAIMGANQTSGQSKIVFNIEADPLISLGTLPLPEINHPVFIDGTTQGAIVRLAPATAGSLEYGLFLVAGRSTVTGLQFEGFANAIVIVEGGSNAIQGNVFLNNQIGIFLGAYLDLGTLGNSLGNLIGGITPEKKNFFLSNSLCGVFAFHSTSNVIAGNVFGAGQGGAAAGNGWGIIFANCDKNVIGGTVPGSGNIITNSVNDGVLLAGSQKNLVLANTITQNLHYGVVLCTNRIGAGDARHAIANKIGISSSAGTGNLISGNGRYGVLISSDSVVKGLNKVQGNFIGTDATGNAAAPNGGGVAIFGSSSNLIGGTKPELRNVISANNGAGVGISTQGFPLEDLLNDTTPPAALQLDTTLNIVQGNRIGTNLLGNTALGNDPFGLVIVGARGSIIGGTTTDAGNLIANNAFTGISLTDAAANGPKAVLNQIIGNTIKGNLQTGVVFTNGVSGNVVGGKTKGLGNQIVNNGNGDPTRAGVAMGTASHNGVIGNSMSLNGSGGPFQGIQSSVDTTVELSRNPGDPKVTWKLTDLDSPPKSTYRIEFFANSESLKAQGETYLTGITAKLGDDHTATGTILLKSGDHFTATATLMDKTSPVVTSVFSNVLDNPPARPARE